MRHLLVPDSDIIESIGYENSVDSKAEAMEVVFKSTPDVVYRYERVSKDAFMTLITAESIGKVFHEMFKKTKYPFTKSIRSQLTLKK